MCFSFLYVIGFVYSLCSRPSWKEPWLDWACYTLAYLGLRLDRGILWSFLTVESPGEQDDQEDRQSNSSEQPNVAD